MTPFSPARDALADLLRRRIVVAPMAGGPTTTELVVAAARAGALGWLAAGYKTPEAMAAEIAAVRAATAEPFGVNVFVPGAPYPDRRTLAGYLDSLGPGLGDASWDDDGFDGKVAALLTDPPAVTSFTFGCPPPGVIRALQDAGSAVVITVTSPAEAVLAEQGGADGLCVQGFQRTSRAGAGQRVHCRARGRAARLPRAQQRHPAAARRRRGPRGHRADVAVGRAGLPPGRRAARRRDHRAATRIIPPAPGGHTRGGREVDGSWENGGRLVKAVRFDEYGGIDVLKVVDVPTPVPGPGQVLVQVKAAGINPGEAKIREGLLHSRWPATFPSGQGTDLAGVVAATGAGVTGFATGDKVIGYTDNRASQAEYVVVEQQNLTAKPAGVPWEVAGALNVVGATAYAAVRAVALAKGDTLVVSGAAGGVGSVAVQLARRAGAAVIGLASPANHDWLAGHGVIPVAYGDGVADRIRQAAGKVDAFIDTFGPDYVPLALELGVEPSRIDTIADFGAVAKYGVKGDGNAVGASASTLAELAALIADGRLEVPIAATYPLGQVREAYRRLASGHIRGKIVLTF